MTSYKVRAGDTLSSIAAAYKTTVNAIAKANRIADPNRILAGQKLVIDTFEDGPKHPRSNPGTSTPAATSTTGSLPVGMPNTENMSDAKEFALYSKYVEKHGDAKAKQDLAAGKRVILGLRVNTPFTSDRPYRGTYDDRIVVLWKDKGGKAHVEEFLANTEPNRRWADDPSQASKPVGRLVGNRTYHYTKSYSSSFGGNILRPDLRYGNPSIRRDTNRDHRIDSRDDVFTGDWGGQGVYFHRGGVGDTYSAGCQTMDQARFNHFWAQLGDQREFSYVLASVG